jgi:hypothetical protein
MFVFLFVVCHIVCGLETSKTRRSRLEVVSCATGRGGGGVVLYTFDH